MQFDIETLASPEPVRRALTNFTEERLGILEPTLDFNAHELREQGARLGGRARERPGSPFWVVGRYDWSNPAVVR